MININSHSFEEGGEVASPLKVKHPLNSYLFTLSSSSLSPALLLYPPPLLPSPFSHLLLLSSFSCSPSAFLLLIRDSAVFPSHPFLHFYLCESLSYQPDLISSGFPLAEHQRIVAYTMRMYIYSVILQN